MSPPPLATKTRKGRRMQRPVPAGQMSGKLPRHPISVAWVVRRDWEQADEEAALTLCALECGYTGLVLVCVYIPCVRKGTGDTDSISTDAAGPTAPPAGCDELELEAHAVVAPLLELGRSGQQCQANHRGIAAPGGRRRHRVKAVPVASPLS